MASNKSVHRADEKLANKDDHLEQPRGTPHSVVPEVRPACSQSHGNAELGKDSPAHSLPETEVETQAVPIDAADGEDNLMTEEVPRVSGEDHYFEEEISMAEMEQNLVRQFALQDIELRHLLNHLKLAEEKNLLLQTKLVSLENSISSCNDKATDLDNHLDKMIAFLAERNKGSQRPIEEELVEPMATLPGNITLADKSIEDPEGAISLLSGQNKSLIFQNIRLKRQLAAANESKKEFANNVYKAVFSFCETLKSTFDADDGKVVEGIFPNITMEQPSDEADVDKIKEFLGSFLEAFVAERNYANSLNEYNIKLASVIEDLYGNFCQLNAEMDSLKERMTDKPVEEVASVQDNCLVRRLPDNDVCNLNEDDGMEENLLEKYCGDMFGRQDDFMYGTIFMELDGGRGERYRGLGMQSGRRALCNSIEEIQEIEDPPNLSLGASGSSQRSVSNRAAKNKRKKARRSGGQKKAADGDLSQDGPSTSNRTRGSGSELVEERHNRGAFKLCFPFPCLHSPKKP